MLPPIRIVSKTSGNANNNPARIEIESKAHPFGAILAQEHYEWWVKIWFFLAAFVPVLLFRFFSPLNRWLELRGHAIEIAVAVKYYGVDLGEYLTREASHMHMGYGSTFSGLTQIQIANKLTALLPWANRWVEKRHKLITRYVNMDPKQQ